MLLYRMAAKQYSVNDVLGMMDNADKTIDEMMEELHELDEFCFEGSDDEVSDLEK